MKWRQSNRIIVIRNANFQKNTTAPSTSIKNVFASTTTAALSENHPSHVIQMPSLRPETSEKEDPNGRQAMNDSD